MAEKFVLVRIVNMRGVDLSLFDFDYDLTWAAFFLNANGKIHGRFGGRDEGPAERHLTLAGLKHAMRQALTAHERDPNGRPAATSQPARTAEQYPAGQRLKKDECIHCHMVYDFRRDAMKSAGAWSLDHVWVYPPPKNIGLILDPDQGNLILDVTADSPAARAGLAAGDVLENLGGVPVASYGDVQYGMHKAPKAGKIAVTWQRDGQSMAGNISVADGWRKSDISWRASMWGLPPRASVYGDDLTVDEKRALGLSERRLAFRQGDYVPKPARNAGVHAKDIIIGIDDQPLEMNMLQFNVHIRLNYKVGDRITFNIIRAGERLDLPMVLPASDGE